MPYTKDPFSLFLRRMSKKGFYGILRHIDATADVHYNEVLRHALSSRMVDSRSQVTVILNTLTDLGLLERTVSAGRPIRTIYRISRKGKSVLHHLAQLEKEIE